MPPSKEIQFSTRHPPILSAWPERGIIHGFLGQQDELANWKVLRSVLPGEFRFARLNQVHGNEVRVVTQANFGERPAADGMVTCERNLMLGIFTADCVPILMSARTGDIVCALHAGWRGVLAGIAEEGVRAMGRLGAKPGEVRAALGPSIGLCCFEVDASLAQEFEAKIPGAARHTRMGKPGKAYLDLRGIVRDQLEAAGIRQDSIENIGPCTRCASDQYFSRRAAGGALTGSQLSFIAIAG